MKAIFKKTLELYLIRNGETVGNLQCKLQGQTEGSLSVKGKKQAQLIARELSKSKISKAYCSPLLRAKDTCFHSGLTINPIYIDLLKERNFGDLTNRTYLDMINLNYKIKPKNGESLVDMQQRAKRFLDRVVKENKIGDKVVAFGHHEIIISCVAYVVGLPLKNIRKMMISNASFTQLDYYDNKWVAKRINELGHLGDLKQTRRVY